MILSFLVYLLAAIGLHRLWNFEEIFRVPREWLMRFPWMKPLTCQVCNPVWIAAGLQAFLYWVDPVVTAPVVAVFAAYAIVRACVWIYRVASHLESWIRTHSLQARTPPPTARPPEFAVFPASTAAAPTPLAEAPCAECGRKKDALIEKQKTAGTYAKRIVLLTTLSNFSPSYSVAAVVCDHARMLAQDPSWLVEIWINEGASERGEPKDFPSNVSVRRIVPQVSWRPDEIVGKDRDRLTGVIRSNLIALGNAVVICHDLIFQASFTTFAAAIHAMADTPGFAWFHVCHSAVLARPTIRSEAIRVRTSLPRGHTLLCLNEAERPWLALYYDTDADAVVVCPNARDFTAFGNVDARAASLVRDHSLADADIVQIMPVSATRLRQKGVPVLLEIFAALQRLGLKTRLVLAVAHANGAEEKKALVLLRIVGSHLGLDPKALVITSEVFPDTAAEGLSPAAIRDLFAISNLFVFPTISEASSLVAVEAALSGCLMVLNDSLHVMPPMFPKEAGGAIYWPFGSLRAPVDAPLEPDPLAQEIHRVLGPEGTSLSNRSKRAALRAFSYQTIGAQLRTLVSSANPLRIAK